MEYSPSILICVLNWGYGHSARCTIIAKHLLSQGHKIYLASDGDALIYLKEHLHDCTFISLPKYNIKYTKSGKWLILKMIGTFFWMIPKFCKEWLIIQKSVQKYRPDVLLSDTRPFCHTFKIPSIYLTNQMEIRPFTLGSIHRLQMRLFDRIWIPAIKQDLIGGYTTKVFKNLKKKTDYIGYLPNFSDFTSEKKEKKYFIAAILSGPEPARTQLENIVIQAFQQLDKPTVIVRGLAGASHTPNYHGNMVTFDFMPLDGVAEILSESEIYLGRSGFSGISMLIGLDIKAIVIPTKGQPEQEANAESMSRNRIAIAYDQGDFDLRRALEDIKGIQSMKNIKNLRLNFSEFLKDVQPLKN